MERFKEKQPTGSLQISQDVIATIASVAALEVEGVAALAQHSPGFRHNPFLKGRPKTVDVVLADDFAEINIGLALKFGAKINDVCTAVQTAVKDNVQTMTGMAVSKVNVYVAKIVFPQDEEANQEN
ncbi:MAG TPA: Asp23/Gls24 family envelope stress response protein [Clostridiales bacterium]|nr:Asp23/Gls24 family envelope stress response protein [Clostridiales bacterium]